MRPLASAPDASPASLRITIRPAEGGVSVEVIKRKGPISAHPLVIPIKPSPILLSPYPRTRRKSSETLPAAAEQVAAGT